MWKCISCKTSSHSDSLGLAKRIAFLLLHIQNVILSICYFGNSSIKFSPSTSLKHKICFNDFQSTFMLRQKKVLLGPCLTLINIIFLEETSIVNKLRPKKITFYVCCDPDATTWKLDGSPKDCHAKPLCELTPINQYSFHQPNQAQTREMFLFPKCPVWHNENKTHILLSWGCEESFIFCPASSSIKNHKILVWIRGVDATPGVSGRRRSWDKWKYIIVALVDLMVTHDV